MPSYRAYVQKAKEQVKSADLAEVKALSESPGDATLIDVREPTEFEQGQIPGALTIPRGVLEGRIEDIIHDPDRPIVVYCAGGARAALAAASLGSLGYNNVRYMVGGYTAWKRAGYPFDIPQTLSADQQIRYSRHTMLPEVGEAGQLKLLRSAVLCIGAGGLGAPSSLYMAAAGIGTIGMVDDDVVDASNLQRQIIHATDRIGQLKVDSAETTLTGLNPDLKIRKHPFRLSSDNVLDVIADYDVIVDGADNFPTRYLLNDAALKLGKPVIHSSIFRFDGQLTVFPGTGRPCYRCLYPEPPPPEEAPSCQEAGVLGVLPGVMGVLQATEAIKVILNIGEPLAGKLLIYDALKAKFRELRLRADPECPTCGEGVDRSKIELIDYVQFCQAR